MKAISVRLTPAEREVAEELARLEGARSISELVCHLIRQRAATMRLSEELLMKLRLDRGRRRTNRKAGYC